MKRASAMNEPSIDIQSLKKSIRNKGKISNAVARKRIRESNGVEREKRRHQLCAVGKENNRRFGGIFGAERVTERSVIRNNNLVRESALERNFGVKYCSHNIPHQDFQA